MQFQITEIFQSIQGESSFAGLPCIFVRLTGCNLRCRWCDTAYAFHGGRRMSLDEVLAAVRGHSARLVEITGGEPMLQAPAVAELARALLEQGYQVLLETSGERDLAGLPAGLIKVMDVKCPDSGEFGSFRESNLALLGERDEVKFVIASRRDYEFAREFIARHAAALPATRLLSPAFSASAAGERGPGQCLLDPQSLAEWMLADAVPARLNLQLHKFIWDPALHGV